MRRVITLLLTIAMALSLVVVANATSTVKQSVYLKTEKVENNDNTVTYTFTLDASKCDGVAAMEFIVETTGLTYAKEYYPEGAELKRVFQPENFNGGGNKPLGFYPDTNKFLAFGGSAAEGRILKGEVKVVALTYNINASNYDLKVTGFKACYDGEQAKLTTTRYNCVIGDGLKGDVNGDGKVNTMDVSRLYAHVRGTNPLSDEQLANADVNGDGKINTMDVSRLYAHVRGTNPF